MTQFSRGCRYNPALLPQVQGLRCRTWGPYLTHPAPSIPPTPFHLLNRESLIIPASTSPPFHTPLRAMVRTRKT